MEIQKETLFSEIETANSKQLAILKASFPQCFDKNGAFIQEKLLEIVKSADVELSKESYTLNWLGKSYARLLANLPPKTLLSEDKEHNQLEQNKNSGNLLIKGDNLEVLKHMINAYSEKVKMIYIDPPYNTGKDGFSYNDDRKFTPNQLSELAGIDLDEATRILDFTIKGSSSHSAWLTFIYPRLYIARELMREDGTILISIDNNEFSQLKLVCDEIFGEQNHVGDIVWKNVTDNNPSNIAIEHEYIVVYAKNKEQLESEWKSNISDVKDLLVKIGHDFASKYSGEELQEKYNEWYREHKSELWPLDRYKYIDKDGVYTGSQSVHNPGKEGYRYDILHPTTKKPCKQPLMGYRFPLETMNKLLSEDKIIFGNDESKLIEIKVYAKDYKQKLSSVINLDGRTGANELREVFPEMTKPFTNPKTIKLLEELISFACNGKGIILDFFAGSGTTAHAILNLNHNNNMAYQFITVQLDEPTKANSDALKNGYETIYDLNKERLIRICKKSGEQGFKCYQLMTDFRAKNEEELSLSNYSFFDDAVLTPEQHDTLLTTWCVYDGSLLTTSYVDVDLSGYKAHLCDSRLYLIAPNFTSEALKVLLQKLDTDKEFSPNKIVVYGSNFESAKQIELNDALKSYSNKKSIELDLVVRN
ncbi:type III restriction endonuclease subunit M [Photorhabdus luminescens]|uniref:site-specific DNA-methyltransferase n=1 Tax=Photorhabdus luminescens TaxID=29488 RepID=UPI000B4D4E78|nr:site-specific DNA-methyltransferase [Photorhabdus luminescens]OWO81542.1 type III restriction endonuclease subunit M [Photorhabdus luminescens]